MSTYLEFWVLVVSNLLLKLILTYWGGRFKGFGYGWRVHFFIVFKLQIYEVPQKFLRLEVIQLIRNSLRARQGKFSFVFCDSLNFIYLRPFQQFCFAVNLINSIHCISYDSALEIPIRSLSFRENALFYAINTDAGIIIIIFLLTSLTAVIWSKKIKVNRWNK